MEGSTCLFRAARGDRAAQAALARYALESVDDGQTRTIDAIQRAELWGRMAASHGQAEDALLLAGILIARSTFERSFGMPKVAPALDAEALIWIDPWIAKGDAACAEFKNGVLAALPHDSLRAYAAAALELQREQGVEPQVASWVELVANARDGAKDGSFDARLLLANTLHERWKHDTDLTDSERAFVGVEVLGLAEELMENEDDPRAEVLRQFLAENREVVEQEQADLIAAATAGNC